EVAQGTVAGLATEERLHRATVDGVLADEKRLAPAGTAVQGLEHVDSPVAVDRVRAGTGGAAKAGRGGGRGVEGDVYPAAVPSGSEGVDHVVETWGRQLHRGRPGRALVARGGEHQVGVAGYGRGGDV